MTSEPSDEPIGLSDDEALKNLAGVADLFSHTIAHQCVATIRSYASSRERPLPMRRSRGYAPRPVKLPFACAGTDLGVGGQLKALSTGSGREAFLSHHLAISTITRRIKPSCAHRTVRELFALRPQCIAHDAHPDYASTRYAVERSLWGQRLVAVQHHHATWPVAWPTHLEDRSSA